MAINQLRTDLAEARETIKDLECESNLRALALKAKEEDLQAAWSTNKAIDKARIEEMSKRDELTRQLAECQRERAILQIKVDELQTEINVLRANPALAIPVDDELTTCNCRWNGDVQVQQCMLHAAYVEAIHEWAERAKAKIPAELAECQRERIVDEAALRNEVIEECALKLKGMRIHEKYPQDKQWNSVVDNCAAAIRQMKGTT